MALPDWLDADRLRVAMWVGVALLVIVGLVVVRLVQRMVTVVVSLALIAGMIAAVWNERSDLEDCQATCSCELFGQQVTVPDNPFCGPDDDADGDSRKSQLVA